MNPPRRTAPVGRSASAGEEVVEDPVHLHDEGDMALALVEVSAGTGDALRQPDPVRKGHHLVLAPLPYRDRDLDRSEVEPPGTGQGEVVVSPADDALLACASK